ncbi:Rnf electron transport complex subunit RnfG [Methanolobus sp. WCC5]|uniref:Rnf electron transport complex subunit RnfG n=1 Tax=Methanolobus sp. WCC5 TaxID=3125785 RepID=UPI003243905B
MTESNKETLSVIGKLVIVAVVAAILLGITYVPTSAQIKLNEELAKQEILSDLFPEDNINFEPVEGDSIDQDGEREVHYYRVTDNTGNIIGYAFFNRYPGYGGQILVAGGTDSSFTTLKGMNVLSHEETPGLGSRIEEPQFRNQFKDVPIESLALTSSGGSIDAITGATVSSNAVVDALNAKIREVRVEEE